MHFCHYYDNNIIIMMIFINVTCYSEKQISQESPTHGGFTSHW